MQIFVPAWGWVGSEKTLKKRIEKKMFSSPLGDGLVRK